MIRFRNPSLYIIIKRFAFTAAVVTSQSATGVSVAMVTNGGGDGPVQNGAAAATMVTQQQTVHPLTNTKEKTPMCLVNELARFNKIQHQVSYNVVVCNIVVGNCGSM